MDAKKHLKIVTFNIRCEWEGTEENRDGANGFISRLGMIFDKIDREKPDIIAFQEVIPRMVKPLEVIFPEYLFCGHGRDTDYSGEGLYTAIKKESLQLIGMENFWIAPDPYDPHSRFEGQFIPRICIGTTVLHKETGKLLRLFNIHLCNSSPLAREEGLKCVLDMANAAYKKTPAATVVLGDFNAEADEPTMQVCDHYDGLHLTDLTGQFPYTFHNYGRGSFYLGRNLKIDYIYVSDDLREAFVESGLWDDCQNGIYLSDHYPIYADFTL